MEKIREKKEIYFVTKNPEKYKEAKVIVEATINLQQLEDDKIELKNESIEQTALGNASYFAKKYNKTVIIDDAGIFFEAYPQFPGAHPKLMYQLLGYKGLLKLLEGESRKAVFRCAIGYCEPNKKAKLFVAEMKGTIAEQPKEKRNENMPYEALFIPEHIGKAVSEITKEEKNKMSHRAKALTAMQQWLASQ